MGGPRYSRACHRGLAGCERREPLMRGGEFFNLCKNIWSWVAATPGVEADMNHQLIAGRQQRAIRLAPHLVPAAQFLAAALGDPSLHLDALARVGFGQKSQPGLDREIARSEERRV